MEVAQAIISSLYTSFLLRDFAGKVVPGMLFGFSVLSLFFKPSEIIDTIHKAPIIIVAFVIGLAWTFTLGMQSIAEYMKIWDYFPIDTISSTMNDRDKFKYNQLHISEFMRVACDTDKNQYERFVVIKEACGNLMVSMLLSIPFWLISLVENIRYKKLDFWHKVNGLFCVIIITLSIFGLFRMHRQHVERQSDFADAVLQRFKDDPCPNNEAKD